jgi:hypothetical protein
MRYLLNPLKRLTRGNHNAWLSTQRVYGLGGQSSPGYGVRHFSGQKTMWKQYGGIALTVYFSISFTLFCCTLTAVSLLDITADDTAHALERIRAFLGISQSVKQQAENEGPGLIQRLVHKLPEWAQSEGTIKLLGNSLIALGITKLLIPVKLGITAAIVPKIVKTLKRSGHIK